MSIWTHVAAVFRIDGIQKYGAELDWDKLIGKECLWESDDKVWDDYKKNPQDYLPMGSEGSLQRSVWVNPDGSSLAAYTVTVFGDLRDYSNLDEIVDWFKNTCAKFWIRQAVITVTNGMETKTYYYKEDYVFGFVDD